MISNRTWMSLCLAGLCWGGVAIAQDTGGGSSAGSGGSGGSAGAGSEADGSGAKPSGTKPSGTKPDGQPTEGSPGDSPDAKPADGNTPPKTGGSVDPFIPTTPKPDKPDGTSGSGASSAFGTPPATPDPNAPKMPGADSSEPGPAGSSSAFGPTDSTATEVAPPTFSLPGFFGSPGTTFTGGQGRLARPRFRYKVTTSQGFDDNVLQTPDDPIRFPDQVILVDPGTPDTVTFVPVTTTTFEPAFADEIVFFRPVTTTTFRREVTPGRDPVFRTIRAPEPQKRTGSLVSRLGIQLDAQQVTRRSLFTVDLTASLDHYWNRPGIEGSYDYSGSLSAAYLYNFTPRLNASVTANVAYIAQPDFTRINTPDRLDAGDLVNALTRLNVSYRLTPRLSATLSVGTNSIIFVNQEGETGAGRSSNGDSFETTFSAEARYLWKPRYSLIAELRHALINYPDAENLNSTTELFLLGADLRLSSRLAATVRLGQAVRIFDEGGDASIAPYGEAAVTYRIGPTSSVQWNSRFGFEEPPSPGSETLSYRTTVTYLKSFTPRLSMSASITGVTRNTTFPGAEDQSEQTVNANVGIEYRFNRQLTLNANYSFTKIITTSGFQDYDRSRIFIGAEYEF